MRGMVEQPGVEEQISVDEFFRADIRAGRIMHAEPLEKARKPAYKLWIDFGELGTRQSSAQVTTLYRTEELIGRMVIAVTNFPPRRVAGFRSEVLVLGVPVEGTDEVVLLQPERDVTPGARIS